MKKGQLVLAVAMLGTALAAPADTPRTGAAGPSMNGETAELRVATIVAPPFIMEQNGSLTGFSIELWNAIAAQLDRKTRYQMEPDPLALEEGLRSKNADLTVAPIFVTSARDEVFDFSHPILQSGLQVMVRGTDQRALTGNPLWGMLRLILSRTTVLWLGMALVLVLLPAHVVWLLERRRADGMIANRKYVPGIFEAIYWALSTLTTQAEAMPRQWVARGLSIFWMFSGVVFVASYTAQLTTTLTVEQIRGAIEGPEDLPGKQVATLAHTLAADYLREHRAQVQEFPTTDSMFEALLDKKVDAVLAGAPMLRYYAAHQGLGRVKVVGPEINIAPIAIMVQLGSPLRKQIDVALIKLYEDGSYQQLYAKWFGSQ